MSGLTQQPFYEHSQPDTNPFLNLLPKTRKKNALLALNNLFASKSPDQIEPEEILGIFQNFNILPSRDFSDGSLRAFYKTFLEFCFDENQLTEEKIDQLKKIKYLLFLDQHSIDQTHHEICQAIYSKELDAVLDDEMLDAREKAFLEKLYYELQVPEDLLTQIKKFSASQILARVQNGFISKNGIKEEEEQLFNVLLENLHIPHEGINPSPYHLELLQLLWHCLNVRIPAMNVDIKLRSNESCIFYQEATWIEERTEEKVKVPKNSLIRKIIYSPYWLVSNNEKKTTGEEKIYRKLNGTVYLTNERILIYDQKKEKIIRLSNIIDFIPYQNGVFIRKKRGRNNFIQTDQFAETLSLLVGHSLRQLYF